MSFLKTKTDESINEKVGGGKYISKSGIYPVTIKIASVDIGDKGSTSVNFNVEDEDGNATTLYNLRLTNNDGSENFQAPIMHRLAIIANLEEIDDPVEEEHKLGKDSKEVTLAVLKEFEDFECIVRVQEVYSKNQKDEIRKELTIRNFYRADGATAEEIISEANGEEVVFGNKLEKDRDYASNVTYKDNLTAADIETWEKARRDSNNGGGNAGASKPKVNKPAGSLFKR